MISESLMRAIDHLPEHMRGGVYRYVERGIHPGDFLGAVLENDLRGATMNADATNLRTLDRYGALLHHLPTAAWGDKDKVNAWCEQGGLSS